MSTKSFTIIGLNELNQLFTSLPKELDTIFKEVGTKFASTVESQANNQVPIKTGYLRSTIGKETTPKEVKIFAKAHYARFVHDGTVWMPARRFIMDPVESQIPKMISEINNRIGSYIKSKSK